MTTPPVGGFAETMKNPMVVAALAAPAFALAARGAEAVIDYVKDRRAHASGYKAMLDMHPHLRQEKPEQITRIYNSVYRANPEAATDPFTVGAIVTNVVRSADHLDPTEGGRVFLSERERLIQQRGKGPTGPGILSQLAQSMGQSAREIGGALHQEHGLRAQMDEQRAHEGKIKEFEKIRTGLQADKNTADMATARLQAVHGAVRRSGGGDFAQTAAGLGGVAPTMRARQFLKNVSEFADAQPMHPSTQADMAARMGEMKAKRER